MSEAPEVVADKGIEVSDKPQLNASSTDVSKTKYSLDGVDDGEAGDDIYSQANPARPGFTKSDQKDMWRMGRLQEFKVGLNLLISRARGRLCLRICDASN